LGIHDWCKIHFLLVDDDTLMLFALDKIIQQYRDLQVVGRVRHGHGALAFLQGTTVNVVLLEIEMPHMNGINRYFYQAARP
jgi:DNA-binding NarL/FixJ family response regulator